MEKSNNERKSQGNYMRWCSSEKNAHVSTWKKRGFAYLRLNVNIDNYRDIFFVRAQRDNSYNII